MPNDTTNRRRRLQACAAGLALITPLLMWPPLAWGGDPYGADLDFLRRATDFSQREVAAARRAIRRSTTPKVIEAAERLRAEGETAGSRLAQLAVLKGWPEASPAASDDSAPYSDAGFVAGRLAAEQAAIEVFRAEARNGADTDLQLLARSLLPQLEQCLVVLKSLHTS